MIDVKRIKELTQIEQIVLSNVLEILYLIKKLEENTLKCVEEGEFVKAQGFLQQSNYFKYTPKFLDKMKNDVLEYCSNEVLFKIIDGIPFDQGSLYTTEVIIPKEVLPKVSSYDSIRQSNPKASVYKKLGATIIAN